MRVLVTGVDCFIAGWLVSALVADGVEIFGISRKSDGKSGGVTRHRADVRDADALAEVVKATHPDRVFHLAAQSNIKHSYVAPSDTLSTNVVGSSNLLEAVRQHAPGATVVSVGSSSEYGDTARDHEWLSEDLPLRPTSPYAVSKVAQGQLATIYARAHGLRVMHVRPFAILGPGKQGDALSEFCRSVAMIELGRANELAGGRMTSLRDFVDVRDCASALRLIADEGVPGETYNVCNQRATSLSDLVAVLRNVSGVAFKLVTDPTRVRALDDARIVGSAEKIRALGHAPRYELADTVRATLEHWRAQVRAGA